MELSVLTFNTLFWGDARPRLAAIARELDRLDLDAICLQEVDFRHRLPILRSGLTGFPHLVCAPFGPFVKGGLVTLSRHPITAWRYEVYGRRGGWTNRGAADRLIQKGFLVAELDADGARVAVVNTHLLANYNGDWSPQNGFARQEAAELRQLAEAARAMDQDVLLVVAGDLNVPRGGHQAGEFLRATGLRDSLTGDVTPTHRSGAAIDYVIARAPEGAGMEIRGRVLYDGRLPLPDGRRGHLSDHMAVEARMLVTPGAGGG